MAKKKEAKLKQRVWRKMFQLENSGDAGQELDDDIVGRVEQRGHNLDIYLDGYGTKTMEPGFGPVVSLDYFSNKLQVLVFGDINEEDPTEKIDLERARETYREPDEDDIEEAWQRMCREHIQPSRLFAIGTGLIEQNQGDEAHFSRCKQCERVLRAYQETMKK